MTVLLLGMLQMSACEGKKMLLVPVVTPVHPCNKQWSSLLITLSHRSLSRGSFDQLPVNGDCFFGDRVYYTIAVFFDLNERTCVLIVGKFLRDGDDRGISKAQVNIVM